MKDVTSSSDSRQGGNTPKQQDTIPSPLPPPPPPSSSSSYSPRTNSNTQRNNQTKAHTHTYGRYLFMMYYRLRFSIVSPTGQKEYRIERELNGTETRPFHFSLQYLPAANSLYFIDFLARALPRSGVLKTGLVWSGLAVGGWVGGWMALFEVQSLRKVDQ